MIQTEFVCRAQKSAVNAKTMKYKIFAIFVLMVFICQVSKISKKKFNFE